jgi:hypothetical protein
VGTFVYFLGLLIWSSKWYSREKSEYATLQPITIASGMIALYLGAVGQISQLQGIGGTFFFLYVIEKYFELPWSQKNYYLGNFRLINPPLYRSLDHETISGIFPADWIIRL